MATAANGRLIVAAIGTLFRRVLALQSDPPLPGAFSAGRTNSYTNTRRTIPTAGSLDSIAKANNARASHKVHLEPMARYFKYERNEKTKKPPQSGSVIPLTQDTDSACIGYTAKSKPPITEAGLLEETWNNTR